MTVVHQQWYQSYVLCKHRMWFFAKKTKEKSHDKHILVNSLIIPSRIRSLRRWKCAYINQLELWNFLSIYNGNSSKSSFLLTKFFMFDFFSVCTYRFESCLALIILKNERKKIPMEVKWETSAFWCSDVTFAKLNDIITQNETNHSSYQCKLPIVKVRDQKVILFYTSVQPIITMMDIVRENLSLTFVFTSNIHLSHCVHENSCNMKYEIIF